MEIKRNVAWIATIGIVALLLMPIVSAVRNNDIASIAISHNGQDVNLECKGFVQHVIASAGGNLDQGYTQCYPDAGGIEIQAGQAMWGDIIQISHNTDLEGFYEGMHTAMVVENHQNGNFKVVDSNYVGHEIVGIHDNWNPVNFAAGSEYDLSAHFYRLGTTDYWDFNIPGYTQSWEAHNIEAESVANDGRYRIDPQRNDPWIQLDGLLLDANYYDSLEINMASNAPNGIGQVYFTTSSSPGYNDNKRVEFYVTNNGNWQTYTIYMANHPSWQGTITGIRIDPAAVGKEGTGKNEFDINPLMLYYKIIKAE